MHGYQLPGLLLHSKQPSPISHEENGTTATLVGSTGASLIVTAKNIIFPPRQIVHMYRYWLLPYDDTQRPFCPNFVTSNLAVDLRDLRLVLMTSPEGRTTVYDVMDWTCTPGTGRKRRILTYGGIEESFALCGAISNSVGYIVRGHCTATLQLRLVW